MREFRVGVTFLPNVIQDQDHFDALHEAMCQENFALVNTNGGYYNDETGAAHVDVWIDSPGPQLAMGVAATAIARAAARIDMALNLDHTDDWHVQVANFVPESAPWPSMKEEPANKDRDDYLNGRQKEIA